MKQDKKKNQVFQSLRIDHIWYKLAKKKKQKPTLSIYSCLDLKCKGYTDCSIEELLLQSVEVLKYYYSLVFWLEQSQEIGLCCNQMYSEWKLQWQEVTILQTLRCCLSWGSGTVTVGQSTSILFWQGALLKSWLLPTRLGQWKQTY